jgi:ketosteroid isomerase-like protein
MTSLRTLLVLFALTAPPLVAQQAEALDKAWAKAVLAADATALDKMLDSGLIYAHATGVVDTKASYLEKLKSKRQVYKTMEQFRVTERQHGSTWITHSWLRVTGVNPQGPFDDKVMMVHVWVKHGSGWTLASHQTTKVDQIPAK